MSAYLFILMIEHVIFYVYILFGKIRQLPAS